MNSLKDKTVIVTGGGRGIGQSTCKLLAEEGANVVITCRKSEEGIATEKDILSKNLTAKFISHDVTNEESWQNVIEETQMLFSQIDAVVNNAGSYNYQSILDCTHESFKSIIDTSLNGCFLGLKYGTEAIRKHNQGGSIVMMSSILSKIGAVNMSALSAAHGGVKLLVKAAACELGKEKIRINSIHPGLVDTFTDEEFEQNYPSAIDSLKFEKESIEMVPFQRKATPNEVAEAIRFLVSDESVFMTGAEIVIDGGFIAQ